MSSVRGRGREIRDGCNDYPEGNIKRAPIETLLNLLAYKYYFY